MKGLQPVLAQKLLETFAFVRDDIEVEENQEERKERKVQPSLLWTATNQQNIDIIRILLAIDGIQDYPLKDGMNAFATALGHQNAKIVSLMITSRIEPRNEILFSARQFLALMKAEAAANQQHQRQEMIDTIHFPVSFSNE